MNNHSNIKINSILLPVENNHPSLHAIEFGVVIARNFNSKVKVLHVVPRNMIQSISDSDLQDRLKEELKGHLEQSGRIAITNAKAIFTEEGIPIETTLIEYGNLKEAILNTCNDFDLIIIGTDGEESTNVDPIIKAIIKNGNCNILVIKGKKTFDKVLVGYDGSEDSKTALKYAGQICQKFGASLLIVNSKKSIFPVIRTKLTKERSEALLNEAKELIEGFNIDFRVQSISQRPARGLSIIAENENSGLIIIGKKGRSLIHRLLIGSVSEKITEIAKTSVLTVSSFRN